MTALTLDLLAGMAHELRTPLGAIGGYAELLELGVHGPVTPAQADGLRRIRSNQQLMVSLLSAFMSYSEAAVRATPLELEPLSMHEFLLDAVSRVSARASERRVAVIAPLEADDPAITVHADRSALETLLEELMLDSVESAAPDGIVRLQVRTADGMASVQWSTPNEPISESATDAVFDPFSRAAKSNRPSASRHALSLPHARLLARAMAGDVHASPHVTDRLVTLALPAA